jgi:hypothetical protein
MSLCPFCKAPVARTTAPCERCGRLAGDHASVAGVQGRTLETDFDDDLDAPLDLAKGSGIVGVAGVAYEGGGRTFDDLFGDEALGPVELDLPAQHSSSTRLAAADQAVPDLGEPIGPRSAPQVAHAPAARESGAVRVPEPVAAAPMPMRAADPQGASASTGASPGGGEVSVGPRQGGEPRDPPEQPAGAAGPTPAEIVARYPSPPTTLWQAPLYACRVLHRQIELRQDLTSLRRRRSPDVPLYEAALRAHDARAFAVGLVLASAVIVIAGFVFFLPVILRFVRAAD